MNILVFNDVRREALPEGNIADLTLARETINLDCMLIGNLRKRGHKVVLFDGYSLDGRTPILAPNKAAVSVAEIIAVNQILGFIYDLHYFGNFTFGLTMLKQLFRLSSIPQGAKLVIYSRFIGREMMDELLKLGIDKTRIVDRNTHRISDVADLF